MKTDFPTLSKIQVINLIDAAENRYELGLLWHRVAGERRKYCLADLDEIIDKVNAHYFYLEALRYLRG